MVTHYNGSRGPVEIATMPFTYAQNARDKLVREEHGAARQGEIDALNALLKFLTAQREPDPRQPAPTGEDIESALAAADLEGF